MTITKNGLTIELPNDCEVEIEGDRIRVVQKAVSIHYSIHRDASRAISQLWLKEPSAPIAPTVDVTDHRVKERTC